MKFIPEVIDSETKSNGEKRIYDALAREADSRNWTVIHSLDIAKHVFQQRGEADFVILMPGIGVLVLEVKDVASVSYSDGLWKLGQHDPERRGPYKQAEGCLISLREYLKSKRIDLFGVPFVSGVWFTRLAAGSLPPSPSYDIEKTLWESSFQGSVTKNLEQFTKRAIAQLSINFGEDSAPPTKIAAIARALSPRFDAEQTAASRKAETEMFLGKALERQLETVKMLEDVPRLALNGLAGTGKTWMAVHFAKLSASRGKKVLFTCFNRLLARSLRAEFENFPEITVTSWHSLLLEIAELEPEAGDGASQFWTQTLPKSALSKISTGKFHRYFDQIIVDEGQDLGVAEYLVVMDELLIEGLDKSQILVVGDFERQGIYVDGPQALGNFRSISGMLVLSQIRTNCRNPVRVGEMTSQLAAIEPGYESYRREKEPGDVRIVDVTSEDKIWVTVGDELEKLRKRFQSEDIVILGTEKLPWPENDAMANLGLAPLGSEAIGKVAIGTVHEFKGLEAHAILLVLAGKSHAKTKDLLYIGGSRALSSLTFIGVKDQIRELL